MILLQSLLNEGEVIAEYIVAGSYCVWNCITTPGNTDIAGALEDTLHRILETEERKTMCSRLWEHISRLMIRTGCWKTLPTWIWDTCFRDRFYLSRNNRHKR